MAEEVAPNRVSVRDGLGTLQSQGRLHGGSENHRQRMRAYWQARCAEKQSGRGRTAGRKAGRKKWLVVPSRRAGHRMRGGSGRVLNTAWRIAACGNSRYCPAKRDGQLVSTVNLVAC
jgi:hypothetical protein